MKIATVSHTIYNIQHCARELVLSICKYIETLLVDQHSLIINQYLITKGS